MADTKGSLDYWRKFFGSAKSDIFELIEKAIVVAAVDRPMEFKEKKDLIVEKLYTSHLSVCIECSRPELQVLNNGEDDPKEEQKNSSNCENPKESQIVGEVMRIKKVLCSNQDWSESVLYESLRSLQLMPLSVETLKATEIGRTVNALRRHSSGHIRKLVLTLIEGWKVLLDQWVNRQREPSIADSGYGCSSLLTSEQKPSSHFSAGAKRKQAEDVSDKLKLEISKKKLHEGYQRAENAKKERMIRVIVPEGLPVDLIEKSEPGGGRRRRNI